MVKKSKNKIAEKNIKIKKLKRQLILMEISASLLLLTASFCIFFFINNLHLQYRFEKNISIDYGDLNQTEIELVNAIINQTKPIYLTVPTKIEFTRNITEVYNNPFQSEKQEAKEMEGTLGFNQWNKIYISYEHNELYLKVVLCHELLHSYLRLSEKSHEIVYDLARYLPCYEVTKA